MALAHLGSTFFEDTPAGLRRLILLLYGCVLPALAVVLWFVAAPESRLVAMSAIAALYVIVGLYVAWRLQAQQHGVESRDELSRRAAEVALQQSEARYRNLVANASLPLAVVAIPSTHVLFANARAIELFELDEAQLTTYRADEFWLVPEAGARFRERILRDGSVTGFEMETRGARGTKRWLTVSANVIEFEGQRATLNIFTDISALKRTEQALADERTFLRTLLATVPEAVWLKDPDGVYLAYNPMFQQLMLGGGPEVEGKTDRDIFPPDLAAQVRARDLEILALDTLVVDREWIAPSADRRILIERSKLPMRDGAGRVIGVLSVARDITAEQATAERLRTARDHYETLLNTATDGIHIVALDGRLLEASPSFYRMLGYPPGEVPKLHISDWDSQWTTPELLGQIATLVDAPAAFETVHRRRDGTLIDVEVSARGITIDGERYLYASSRDISERKRAERVAQEQREKLANIFATMSEGVALNEGIFDEHGDMVDYRVLEVNDAFYRTADYQGDRVVGALASEIYGMPADVVREFWRSHRHSTEVVQTEMLSPRRLRWFFISTSPIVNGRFLTTFLDITERKEAEIALAREHQRLDRIIEGTNVGTWEWNVQTGETAYNDRWMEIVGYTREELEPVSIGTWQSLAHPDDLAVSSARLDEHFRGDTAFYEVESRMRHKDGHWVWVLDRGKVATRTADGRPLLMMGTHQDISERKATEAQLLDAHQRFEKIFRSNPALMAISSMPDRRFVDVNDAFLRALGYTRDEVIGRTSAELALTPVPERQTNLAGTLTELGHIEDREMPVRRKDGSLLTGLFSGELLTIQERQELLTVMLDVTEQRRARAALVESEARADAANRAKSEFLANMSHELRTPMNGVIGMAGLLLDSNLNDEQRRHAEALRQSGESLLTLINDILDISKIESGKFDLETIDFELQKIIGDCRELLSDRVRRKGLAFTCEVDADVPTSLSGDPGRLRQILLNLFDNGVKFTERGSISAQVTVDRRYDDRVILRFAVHDTGIGIPAEKMPLLFRTFSQGDASVSRRFGGTGLGLAISKQLAELMGGHIGVSSEAGRGSEFWFTVDLGVAARAAVAPTTDTATPMFDGRKARILVAEDNATNQMVALGMLRKMGLSGDAVADGAEAVRAVATVPYDLVLMDVQMPDVDGLEATRLIREAETAGQHIPIIAMTAHAMPGDRERCLTAGMDDYLAKPVSPRQLGDMLNRWLPTGTDTAGIRLSNDARAAARSEEPRVFDREGMLNRVMNDEDAARFVTRSFLEDIPKRIAALADCLAQHALADAERQAHTIKGAAATIGGEGLRAAALSIEKAARDGDRAAAQHLFRSLQEEFERLRRALHAAFTL